MTRLSPHGVQTTAAISHSLSTCYECQSESLLSLLEALDSCQRIFVLGAGRSGLVSRFFAMRLMQLGLRVHAWGDCTTPSVEPEDLVIAISGSGETVTARSALERAAEQHPTLATITLNPESTMGRLSQIVIVLNNSDVPIDAESLLPLGTSFELSSLMLLEGLVAEIMARQKVSEETMRQRHNILE